MRLLRVTVESVSLYVVAGDVQQGDGWIAYLLPVEAPQGPWWGEIPIADTLPLGGYYVIAPRPPASISQFVADAWSALATYATQLGITVRTASWFAWFADADAPPDSMVADLDVVVLEATPGGFAVGAASSAVRLRNIVLDLGHGTEVAYDDALPGFRLGTAPTAALTVARNGLPSTVGTLGPAMTIPVTGPQRGCVTAALGVSVDTGWSVIAPSIAYYAIQATGPALTMLRFALFPPDALGVSSATFAVRFDPTMPESSVRTALAFTEPSPVASYLRTATGEAVSLSPSVADAQIVLSNAPPTQAGGAAQPGDLAFGPEGEFSVSVPGSEPTTRVVCGLAGTEFVAVPTAGTTVTFAPRQPALVPFPLDAPPPPGVASLLGDGGGGATTSWASWASDHVEYHAQPQPAPLFAGPDSSNTAGVPVLVPHEDPVWSGSVTACAPIVPYAGVPADTSPGVRAEVDALERRVLANVRQRRIRGTAGVPARLRRSNIGGDVTWTTDHRGIRVGVGADGWSAVTLGWTVPAANQAATAFTLDVKQQLVAEALQGTEVFLVATTQMDAAGRPLFDFEGTLYLAEWGMVPGLATTWDTTATVGLTTPMMIIKLGSQSVRQLASGALAQWTDPEGFLPEPAATQAALAGIIAAADADVAAHQSASDPGGSASLFNNFVKVVDDPTWCGALFLNGSLSQAPPVIQGALSGVPPTAWRWHHAGITLNKVTPTAALPLAGSATFGLVDYTAAPAPPPATDFTFATRTLKALFLNSALASFTCQVGLGLGSFFGVPLRQQAPATDNVITIDGVYQARPSSASDGDTGVYSFITTNTYVFDFDYSSSTRLVTAEILASLTLTKVQLTPGAADAASITSQFLFWGALAFQPMGQPSAHLFDVFNYDTLPFGGMALLMTSPAAGGPPTGWAIATGETTFDVGGAQLRPGLVGGLPLKLRGLLYANPGAPELSLAALDYQALGLPPGNPDQASSATAGFVYTLELGTRGSLGTSGTIVASVVTAWTATGGVLLGIAIPGLGSSSSLTFEGVIKVNLGDFRLNQLRDANELVTLEIASCTYQVLNATFPPAPLAMTTVIAAPPEVNAVLWYAAYPPPQPSAAVEPAS
ncbi:MAG TPA: hypothetical protein VFB78_06680 [Acidimicrobiales bacterium]|nr:hypothetical protein [Acidimicrobiales bacterium]